MKEVFEASIDTAVDRVLSLMGDQDIAMITAFRTEPDSGLSPAENTERSNRLESDLNDLGYKGYVRMIGYWDRISDGSTDLDTGMDREEIFLVLNVGNIGFEAFAEDMTGLQLRYGQPYIFIWNHRHQKAYVSDADGRLDDVGKTAPASLTTDALSVIWTEIKADRSRRFLLSGCYRNDGFSARFNEGGNFMTAMMYETNRKRLRKGNSC